ncbi:MAG: hypothetical protein A4E53_00383 [Pelotomaculum sp. PtaB.Bin104]|nr:MAG: hypothetical protein A4E53_00383 [Pelotomaculum sp. PtaB.Bin104]
MGRFEKLVQRFYDRPVPSDISYQEAARLLIGIGCIIRKGSGSHRVFNYHDYPEPIVLVERDNLKQYQVQDIRKLLEYIGLSRMK